MIVVTGGAGFIGSAIVRALNREAEKDILVVDDLRRGYKCSNLTDCILADYLDKDQFLTLIQRRDSLIDRVSFIFHQGACTVASQEDGRLVMDANYQYSKEVLALSTSRAIPLVYASSASVYGNSRTFREDPCCEKPLTLYAFSKWLFDNHVRRALPASTSLVAGLRYFEVYGPREAHKGTSASMVLQLHRQVLENGSLRLYGACAGCGDGEQRRDYVHVDDVAQTNIWFFKHAHISGIFNVGTGHSRSFNELAQAIAKHHGEGTIEYIPFPKPLRGIYQTNLQADLTRLRQIGCDVSFRTLEKGLADYLAWLEQNDRELPGAETWAHGT